MFPTVEDSRVTFSCTTGQVLDGLNQTTCRSSGLWDPDPTVVRCKGDFACQWKWHNTLGLCVPWVFHPYSWLWRSCHSQWCPSELQCHIGGFKGEIQILPNTTVTACVLTLQKVGMLLPDHQMELDQFWFPPPSPPSGGSIGSYTSTEEGANVTFQCDVMTAVNGEWLPNPAEALCTQTSTTGNLHWTIHNTAYRVGHHCAIHHTRRLVHRREDKPHSSDMCSCLLCTWNAVYVLHHDDHMQTLTS